MCRDAARVFNFTTGYGRPRDLDKLVVAPFHLRDTLIRLTDEEIEHAEAGRPATIWAKLNALVDSPVIDALYRASGAGVQIRLVVRNLLPATGHSGAFGEHHGTEPDRTLPGA